MARNYSPKTFLRQAPNVILKEYFRRRGELTDIDFDGLTETQVDPIFEAMEAMPPSRTTAIETDFRQINELACPRGVEAILEEAAFRGKDWSERFAGMKNHHEKAFWTFLHDPSLFHVAGCFDYMDRVGFWRQRFAGKGLRPALGDEHISRLAAEITEFYARQGRGRYCHVDNYLRKRPDRHCYFVYPEDYPTTDIGYDEQGQFQHRPRRPAFENVFVYRPEDGMLELHAKGKKEHIEGLQEIFCKTILGLDELPEDDTGPAFDLSVLRSRDFASSPTDPEDGVRAVFVRRLRLDLLGVRRRITLEAGASLEARHAIYALADKALNKEHVSLEKAFINLATLTFVFSPRNGQRAKRLTFDIANPDRCTLKDDYYDQIAKKYLRRWGIARE